MGSLRFVVLFAFLFVAQAEMLVDIQVFSNLDDMIARMEQEHGRNFTSIVYSDGESHGGCCPPALGASTTVEGTGSRQVRANVHLAAGLCHVQSYGANIYWNFPWANGAQYLKGSGTSLTAVYTYPDVHYREVEIIPVSFGYISTVLHVCSGTPKVYPVHVDSSK
ncbi:uncharacterized protein [Oscarella lobularis]|uniref:uncharacterized protein n=1 Tax=Oscarella lobularis TaxID=121494 RepID=UPI00331420DC